MEDILVPLGFFAIIPLTTWAVVAYRHKRHNASMELLGKVANANQPINPELVRSLGVIRRPKHADLRTGIILLAIGLATLLASGAVPDDEADAGLIAIAMFPLLIGAALIGFWALVSRKEEMDGLKLDSERV